VQRHGAHSGVSVEYYTSRRSLDIFPRDVSPVDVHLESIGLTLHLVTPERGFRLGGTPTSEDANFSVVIEYIQEYSRLLSRSVDTRGAGNDFKVISGDGRARKKRYVPSRVRFLFSLPLFPLYHRAASASIRRRARRAPKLLDVSEDCTTVTFGVG